MLYNLCLHLNVSGLTPALTAATLFILMTIAKEKKHERKRA